MATVRRSALTLASLFAACFVASPGGEAPDTGDIAGHVTLTTRIKGRALPSTVYPTRAVGGTTDWVNQAGVSVVWAHRWW